jgi:hypothetical protein
MAAPGVTEIAMLVAEASVPLATEIVYPLPALLMLRPEKTATPLEADTVNLPPSVPPGSATVTLPVKLGTTSWFASSAMTVNPKLLPATTVPGGSVVTTSCVTSPTTNVVACALAGVAWRLPTFSWAML